MFFRSLWCRQSFLALLVGACLLPDAMGASIFRGGLRRSGADATSTPEDKQAAIMLQQAKDAMDQGQQAESIAKLRSLADRYPTSLVRFEAYFLLGEYYSKSRKYDDSIMIYNRILREGRDTLDEKDERIIKATFKMGEAYYEAGKYANTITLMRKVVDDFPGTEFSSLAYYYIGMSHFKCKRWSKAIESLQLVGTDASEKNQKIANMEIRKRFFVKVGDADLAILRLRKQNFPLLVQTLRDGKLTGEQETIDLSPLNMKGDAYIGSISTDLGEVTPNDGVLDLYGNDSITVSYKDANTADGKVNQVQTCTIGVLCSAVLGFVDSAYKERLDKIIMDDVTAVRVIDYDRDLTAGADSVRVRVRSREPRRKVLTEEEMIERGIEDSAKKVITEYINRDEKELSLHELESTLPEYAFINDPNPEKAKKAQDIFNTEVNMRARGYVPMSTWKEAGDPKKDKDGKKKAEKADAQARARKDLLAAIEKCKRNRFHTGVFVGDVMITSLPEDQAADPNDDIFHVRPGDVVEIEYLDQRNADGEDARLITARGEVLESKASQIVLSLTRLNDIDARIQRDLQMGESLLELGKIFANLGLTDMARFRFETALSYLEKVAVMEKQVSSQQLERMFNLSWKVRVEMGDYAGASQVCQVIMTRFPNSPAAEQALLALGQVSLANEDFANAARFYGQLAQVPGSPFRAEAQYRVGEAYEAWAKRQPGVGAQALAAYEAVVDRYGGTPWAGESVLKIAAFYMLQNNNEKAIAYFEKVEEEFSEQDFMPKVLYYHGLVFYKQKKYQEAKAKWQQVISDWPDAPEAKNAQKNISTLAKKGLA